MHESRQALNVWQFSECTVLRRISQLNRRIRKELFFIFQMEDTSIPEEYRIKVTAPVPTAVRDQVKAAIWIVISIALVLALGQLR